MAHLLYLSKEAHLFDPCGHVEAYTNSNKPGMLLYTAMTLFFEASLTCQVCCWHYKYQLDNLINQSFPHVLSKPVAHVGKAAKLVGVADFNITKAHTLCMCIPKPPHYHILVYAPVDGDKMQQLCVLYALLMS